MTITKDEQLKRRTFVRGRKFEWIALDAVAIVVIAAAAIGPLMSRAERPQYRIIAADGPIEIRS